MASKDDTNLWIQFFADAGIPSNISVKYALTFTENRIRKNMLLDLNKEYLKEMGISLMGDIICILKHAKEVYEEDARDNALKNTVQEAKPALPKKSPASRILEHYIKKESPESSPSLSSGEPKVMQRLSVATKRVITKTTKASKLQIAREKDPEMQVLEPPKKKVRRVLPEHEGKYKVIMPSGTTPRTQKILSAKNAASSSKKNVFERLGEGNVSSTTDVEHPKITITGLGNHSNVAVLRSGTSPDKSVFSRLGNKRSAQSLEAPNKEQSDEEIQVLQKGKVSLEYAGILKKTSPIKKKVIKTIKGKTSTLVADQAQKTKIVHRLGTTMASSSKNPTVAKVLPMKKVVRIPGKPIKKTTSTLIKPKSILSRNSGSGIKVRLGSNPAAMHSIAKKIVAVSNQQAQPEAPSTTFTRTFNTNNVFSRLGR